MAERLAVFMAPRREADVIVLQADVAVFGKVEERLSQGVAYRPALRELKELLKGAPKSGVVRLNCTVNTAHTILQVSGLTF